MRYAMINNGIVTNVFELREKNAADFPGSVKLENRPVGIGDTYADGKFYRDGTELLTPAEEIEYYKAALQTLGVETEETA